MGKIVRGVGWYSKIESPRAYSAVALPNLHWASISIGVDLFPLSRHRRNQNWSYGHNVEALPNPFKKKITNPIAFYGQGVIGGWPIIIIWCLVVDIGMCEKPFCTILCIVLLVKGYNSPFFMMVWPIGPWIRYPRYLRQLWLISWSTLWFIVCFRTI